MQTNPMCEELRGGYTEYSLNEKKIGKWIDGSTLYQKTYDFGTLPNNTTKSLALDISNLDKIVSIDGIAIRNDGNTLSIPAVSILNISYGINVYITSSLLRVETAFDFSQYTKSYFTIRYTKTA